MISTEMAELGRKRSVIRELFEYGKQRSSEIGAENVFDFSIGNPNVPTPEKRSRSCAGKCLHQRIAGYNTVGAAARLYLCSGRYVS